MHHLHILHVYLLTAYVVHAICDLNLLLANRLQSYFKYENLNPMLIHCHAIVLS